MRAREIKRLENREELREYWSAWCTNEILQACRNLQVDVKKLLSSVDQLLLLPPNTRTANWIRKLTELLEYQFSQPSSREWHHVPITHPLYNWSKSLRELLQASPSRGETSQEKLRKQALIAIRFPRYSQTQLRSAKFGSTAAGNLRTINMSHTATDEPEDALGLESRPASDIQKVTREPDTASVKHDEHPANEHGPSTEAIGETMSLFRLESND